MLAFAAFLLGPSSLLNFPDILELQIAGMLFGGLAKGLMVSFVFAWASRCVAKDFRNYREEAQKIYTTLYSSFFQVSVAILPLFCSLLYNKIGF